MTSKPADIQSRLARLQQDYARQLPERVQQIEQAWKGLLTSGEAQALEEMIRLCHTLAGSGASYGFEQITRVCRAIEQQLRDIDTLSPSPDTALQEVIQQQLQQLHQLAAQAPDNPLEKHTRL